MVAVTNRGRQTMRNNRLRAALAGILALSMTFPAFGQPSPPGWIADTGTGCRVWNPFPKADETITWSGACKEGLADGQGILQWFEGGRPAEKLEGTLRDGKPTGHAVTTWPDGERYAGDYQDYRMHGRGIYTFSGGDRYDGEWRDDKPNGQGTYASATGELYQGVWNNGCFKDGERRMAVMVSKEDCGFQ